jgi:hypothetical protein
MSTEQTKRGVDYDLKDPAILGYLDKNHAELRFAKFSGDIGSSSFLQLSNIMEEKGIDEVMISNCTLRL